MLRKLSASLFSLCLVFLATPLPTSAQVAGTVGGKFNFIMDDELVKSLEFSATTAERGGATGFMVFTDETKVLVIDPDGDGEGPKEEPVPFFMKAEFDSMTNSFTSEVIRVVRLRLRSPPIFLPSHQRQSRVGVGVGVGQIPFRPSVCPAKTKRSLPPVGNDSAKIPIL